MSDRNRQGSTPPFRPSRLGDQVPSRLVRRARGETIVFHRETPPGRTGEPQKRQTWPWIMLVVVVLLIALGVAAQMLGLFGRGTDDSGVAPGPGAGGPTDVAPGSPVLRFLPAQERTEMGWAGFRTLVGDVNGDGRADLFWNLTADTNRLYVGLGQADGSFQLLPQQDRPERRWESFQTLVGDVNGDGRADLLWNETNAEHNRVYAGLAQADGTFLFVPAQDHPEPGWADYRVLAGDVDGDGRTDLVWNLAASTNRLCVGLGQADGTFQFLPPQVRDERGWSGFQALLGDVSGDGRADLIWNEANAEQNRVYVGLAQADGTFEFLPAQDHPEPGWAGYGVLAGDVDGDGRADLVWNAISATNRLCVGLGQADGSFQFLPAQEHPEKGWAGVQTLLGDVNGDGRADLVWNALGAANRIHLGLAQVDGSFVFPPAQDHPEQGWAGFRTLLGDVDGDGRADLIWNLTQEANRVLVGLSGE